MPLPDPPRVSVVIPVRDDSRTLAECLAALAAQSRPADEIVVVDNGSSDASAAVAACAGARVVRCLDPGIPAASATGYDAATGDLLLRLDADCRPSPTWIERMVDEFAAHPEVAAVSGGAWFVDGPRWLRRPLAAAYLFAYAAATAPALGHVPLLGSNLALRRSAWREVRHEVHRHDPELHDDLDLAFHVGARHPIRYRPGLGMGMSMRPFRDAGSFARRMMRGIRTVTVHWPREFPPFRWVRLVRRHGGRTGAASVPSLALAAVRPPAAGGRAR